MLDRPRRHPPARARGERARRGRSASIAWMHTFSPAKMWIAGLDALRKPLLHLHTQANVELPWAEIDFDFMNLNQAAHGDREFGYIQTRLGVARKTVVGPRLQPGGPAAGRGLAARRRRLGGSPLAQARPLRRQHALRRGHRGRQDRGRAAVRRPGQHLGRQRARRAAVAAVRTPTSTPWSPSTSTLYDVAPRAAARRRPPPVAARRRGDRARPALVPRGGRLRRVHHELRGPRRAASSCPASPCSG